MELSSIRARPTTPTALPTRLLDRSNSITQTSETLASQFADQLKEHPRANEPPANPLATNANITHGNPAPASGELREAFQNFVGQTFFAEMIKACRSGQQPSAYFNGGRAEEIFQGQLDQVLSEELSKSSADKIADPMFELFMLKRQS